MAIYPAAATRLLHECHEYREKRLGLAAFKRAVWEAAQTIVAVEERAVLGFLQSAEGQLDIIEHTTDHAKAFAATLPLVLEIEERMRRYVECAPGT